MSIRKDLSNNEIIVDSDLEYDDIYSNIDIPITVKFIKNELIKLNNLCKVNPENSRNNFILFLTDIKDEVTCEIYTNEYKYFISACIYQDGSNFLSGTVQNRTPMTGTTIIKKNNLPCGSLNMSVWFYILTTILSHELKPLHESINFYIRNTEE